MDNDSPEPNQPNPKQTFADVVSNIQKSVLLVSAYQLPLRPVYATGVELINVTLSASSKSTIRAFSSRRSFCRPSFTRRGSETNTEPPAHGFWLR